jgi:hypothetical protein
MVTLTVVLLGFLLGAPLNAAPLGTGFTYQGQLQDGAVPTTATSCDFQFSLYDALSGGAQIGTMQTASGVPVNNGIFTVELNSGNELGATIFDGSDRWLQIAARCPSGSGSFATPFSPRQKLTAAPNALYAKTAGDVTCSGCVGSGDIQGGAVGTAQIGDNQITTAKIADNQITTAKLADTQITAAKIAPGANGQVLATNGGAVVWQTTLPTPPSWGLTGNAGTTSVSNYLGTTDNQAIELRVNGKRALRLEPPPASDADAVARGCNNVILGSPFNSVAAGVTNATIGGGGILLGASAVSANANHVVDDGGTVGGGGSNTAAGGYSTVGGGYYNAAAGVDSTVGGGAGNTASGGYSTVGGGETNTAGFGSTVGGGAGNTASGGYSTIGGGYNNAAAGVESTVGGGAGNYAGDLSDTTKKQQTVGGGIVNTASGDSSTIGGGTTNTASGLVSTVGGGDSNTASGFASTVAGGTDNKAYGSDSTVGGGTGNMASGFASTVAGGSGSMAYGDYSFAAGRRAKANNNGSFVWADSTDADYASADVDTFNIRATKGVRLGKNAGSANIGTATGQHYRDNGILAWGSISANGSVDRAFGVYSISHPATGQYVITVDVNTQSVGSLVPTANAEVDSPPTSAGAARLVTINEIDLDSFAVYITNGSYALVDNDFTFIVTGRGNE